MKHEVIKKLKEDDGCAGNSKLIDINIEKGVNERRMNHGEQHRKTLEQFEMSRYHGTSR